MLPYIRVLLEPFLIFLENAYLFFQSFQALYLLLLGRPKLGQCWLQEWRHTKLLFAFL